MTLHRRLRLARAAALALIGLTVGGALSVSAPPATHAEAEPALDDFSYSSWDVAVDLDTTDEGRAIARVTESIVAEFPEQDVNRGMIRRIPQEYLGADTDPRDITVTTTTGAPVPFEVEHGSDDDEDAHFVAVLTGDDNFVRGSQSYVISYTIDDVVLSRDDQQADEFYWDLLPLNRAQPISAATATVTFSDALTTALTGNQRCYTGVHGSTTECEITPPTPVAPGVFSLGPISLAPHEGLTVGIGLAPGTVTQPASRLPNFTLDTLPLFVGGGAIAASGVGALAAAKLRRQRRGTGVVIAQYDVPHDLPPLLAGPIAGAPKPTPPAELVHLALLGATRIEDVDGAKGKPKKSELRLAMRLLAPERAADPLDQETVTALFPEQKPDTLFVVPEEDEEFSNRMTQLTAAGTEAAIERGYIERVRSPLGRVMGWLSLALVAVLAVLIGFGLATRFSITPAIALVLAAVALVLGLVSLSRHRVLTPRGAEARTYLLGVREFIRVAEADRIRLLQGTATAERASDGDVDVIQLYERLLPYAMLFGLEKGWGEALADRYQHASDYVPLWYPGISAGGFDRLGSSITQFSSSISAAATYSASSAGGSTGGGFAGGGGGGGFAGGR